MSKVYVLCNIYYDDDPGHYDRTDIVGVVTKEEVAIKYRTSCKKVSDRTRDFEEFELDDPELLNRIAKESEKK